MPTTYIETAQNVIIEHDIASLGDRVVAQILDYVIIFAYYIGVSFLSIYLKLGYWLLVFFLPVMFYSLICELAFNGQSFGKMVMKTRVVKLDGSETRLVNYFLRWIFRIIDTGIGSGLVALITVAVNGKQRLGDIVAGTTVVKLRHKNAVLDTLKTEPEEKHQIAFHQAEMLTEEDINTIDDVLKYFHKNNEYQGKLLLLNTKKALMQKLNLESELHPKVFLETLLKDYHKINAIETKNEFDF